MGRDGLAAISRIGFLYSWPKAQSGKVSDLDLTVQNLPTGLGVHPRSELALVIDAKGHIESCDVAKTSGAQAVDEIACKTALATEDVTPAKNEAGVPVTSVQSFIVSFGVYAKLAFRKDPKWAAFGDSGPYFPDRAQRMNIGGYADMSCMAGPQGELTDCALDEEAPLGMGFWDAAQMMAAVKWVTVSSPGSAGPVLVRIEFPRPGSLRRP